MEVMCQALAMHQDKDLPYYWLNRAGDIFIKDNVPFVDFISFPSLKVRVVSPDYLLAMEIKSSRRNSNDFIDTKFLIDKLKITNQPEAKAWLKNISRESILIKVAKIISNRHSRWT
jgi:hypothetical protein